MLQPAGADAVKTFLVFLELLERQAEASATSVWLMSSMSRRIRKRLPTCLSVGLIRLFGIKCPQ